MVMSFLTLCVSISFSAYHHMDENDSDQFIDVYPSREHTKLDSCALCHSGGQYEKKPGVFITMGSCQWCHYKYGYDASGNILETINPYGKSFHDNGRNVNAIKQIEEIDSDQDGFTNIEEIKAIRYPGDSEDDPDKIVAPFRVYTKSELQQMNQHTQFMLMNTSRSGDSYVEYTGVPLEDLLENAEILPSATAIVVYAPDGWSTYHPLEPEDDPNLYHIKGLYPQATYYYNAEAESWCEYTSPLCSAFSHGSIIPVNNGLKALIALQRDGSFLTPGILNAENRLDGSGPYRIVVPQKVPCAPDQSSRSDNQDVIWPYNHEWDHNAGFCTRSVTIIKVEPLPQGTTDINVMEAGWNYIDQEKIIIYGAIKGISGGISGQLSLGKDNGKTGLSGAEIRIVETGHRSISASNGMFTIENIPIGSYSLTIKHNAGQLLRIEKIEVTQGNITTLPEYIFPHTTQTISCDIDNDGNIGLNEIIFWLKNLIYVQQ